LRESSDEIEAEGIRRARERAADADFKLLLIDATDPASAEQVIDLKDENSILIMNKMDLAKPSRKSAGLSALPLSVKTGEGISELLQRLEAEVARRFDSSGAPVITRARHRETLENCRAALVRSSRVSQPELMVEDVRLATRALGRITGRVGVEDLLDVIFKDFCIGK
jgi:tRNA modification GTPase